MGNNDEDFLNVSSEYPKDTEGGKKETSPTSTNSPPSKYNIIERKMFTCTTFRIYLPSGKMYPIKSQSWFDKNQKEVKKKVRKKLDVKKAQIGKEECY